MQTRSEQSSPVQTINTKNSKCDEPKNLLQDRYLSQFFSIPNHEFVIGFREEINFDPDDDDIQISTEYKSCPKMSLNLEASPIGDLTTDAIYKNAEDIRYQTQGVHNSEGNTSSGKGIVILSKVCLVL